MKWLIPTEEYPPIESIGLIDGWVYSKKATPNPVLIFDKKTMTGYVQDSTEYFDPAKNRRIQ